MPYVMSAARERDVAAGDRRGARAAVGLEHVAVDGDRALAEPREVDDAAQRAADQALDLVRPAADAALGRFAVGALGGGARQHRVLGGDPARALAAEMRRDAVGDRRRAQDLGVAHPDAGTSPRPISGRRAVKLIGRRSRGPRPSDADLPGRLPMVIVVALLGLGRVP